MSAAALPRARVVATPASAAVAMATARRVKKCAIGGCAAGTTGALLPATVMRAGEQNVQGCLYVFCAAFCSCIFSNHWRTLAGID